MKRRTFITLLGSAAAWPLAARAEKPAMPVVGFLHIASLETRRQEVASFYQGLKDIGYRVSAIKLASRGPLIQSHAQAVSVSWPQE